MARELVAGHLNHAFCWLSDRPLDCPEEMKDPGWDCRDGGSINFICD